MLIGLPVASAATITGGVHNLLPNTPGQVIQIMASGGDSVEGIVLSVITGDGGSTYGGSIEAPGITFIDVLAPGKIFGTPNNTGDLGIFFNGDQAASTSTTTPSGSVIANGLLATVTIDTTGFVGGSYVLDLTGLNESLLPSSSFPGDPTQVINGVLNIVPEPSSIVLGLFAAAGMAAVVIRRRRSA
jgi:hypothetical protein